MKRYKDWQPTGFDPKGLNCEDQQDWFVLPCAINRDSDILSESNFKTAEKILEEIDPNGEEHTVHRFGHWACGWFEIILVKPDTKAAKEAQEIENALSDYPILDDSDYSERMQNAADELWSNFTTSERINFIKKHRRSFEFHSMKDIMACVRGKYFLGDTHTLLDE